MSQLLLSLADERWTEALGGSLAECLDAGTIYLEGNLGAGKTTLVRGFLRRAGHQGPVRSPTYTLLEPYHLSSGDVFHFDLYRLADPEELEFLGIRDYLSSDARCLIEWPERGFGMLPAPDITVTINYLPNDRGREVICRAATAAGERALECLRSSLG